MSDIPILLLTGLPDDLRLAVLKAWLQDSMHADTLLLAAPVTGKAAGHLLFAPVRAEDAAPFGGGMSLQCACCLPQRGVTTALREATWRFARGGERLFGRVIVDAGAADPSALLRTLTSEPAVTAQYRLAQVVAVARPEGPPWVVDASSLAGWTAADVLVVPAATDPAGLAWLDQVVPAARVVRADDDAALSVLRSTVPTGVSAAATAWLSSAHAIEPT